MDEGELLALRLPLRALPLLRLACRVYQDAGDTLGELCALVSGASAMSRASGDRLGSPTDSAWPALDDLRAAYERFAHSSQAALPSWDDLCGGTPLDDLVASLAPWLKGWAERLVLTVDLLRQGGRVQDRRPTLEALRYIAARYSDGLPMELALGPLQSEPPVQARRQRSWWLRSLPWTVPIVVYVGSNAAVYASGDGPGAVFWTVGILSFVAFLYLCGFVLLRSGRALGRSFGSFRAARADVSVSIVPVRPELALPDLADLNALLRIRVQSPLLTFGWPLLRPGKTVVADGVFRGSASAPLAVAAEGVPPQVAGQLAKLADRLRRRHVTVNLDVGYHLSGVPWEAFLGLAVTRLGRPLRALRFARTTRPLTAGPTRQTRRGALFFCPSEWLALVHAVWGVRAVIDESEDGPAAPVSVIHLLGTPVQTSAGRRISVAGAGQGAALDVPVEAAVRAANLVDPARLPIGDQTLVVVQQEPVSAIAWVKTDRQRSAALRAYAADVFLAGAAAVVFIPSLEPSRVKYVLKPLASASRRPMERDQLLRVLVKVRKRIADPDIASEVTVFAAKGPFGGIPSKRDGRKE